MDLRWPGSRNDIERIQSQRTRRAVEIDMQPFYETARLLYEGPWVAERYAAVRSVIESNPDAMHPVTRDIILAGRRPNAADAFTAFCRLEELRRVAQTTFRTVDVLSLPTAPTVYTVAQVMADDISSFGGRRADMAQNRQRA